MTTLQQVQKRAKAIRFRRLASNPAADEAEQRFRFLSATGPEIRIVNERAAILWAAPEDKQPTLACIWPTK